MRAHLTTVIDASVAALGSVNATPTIDLGPLFATKLEMPNGSLYYSYIYKYLIILCPIK